MNTFKDREKGFEKKFANDQEAEFKISAKRNKLLGGWVADILKYDEEKKKNYIVEVIKADFQEAGDEDVFRKIKKDLEGRSVALKTASMFVLMAVVISIAACLATGSLPTIRFKFW